MRSVLKSIGAVLAGFVAASIVMMVVESINGHVLYPEMGKAAEGVMDREALRTLVAAAPIGALFVVIFGWILGSTIGGWVTTLIAGRGTLRPALILGVLLTLAGVANNLMIPPPMWFWCVSLIVFIPAAYVGARLAPAKRSA